MAIHAGMTALETGVFRCVTCGTELSLEKGERIPFCPNRHSEFEDVTQERREEAAGQEGVSRGS
jgi:Zn finger protein HypA/HybF involved in hydrogenase expression